jgi:hypothetical protein
MVHGRDRWSNQKISLHIIQSVEYGRQMQAANGGSTVLPRVTRLLKGA